MPNTLKGVKVKGQQYHFDHKYLDNNPIPACGTDTEGSVLIAHVCNLEWASIDNVLDSSSASAGDVLMATGQGIAWRSVSGFPTYDTTYPSDDGGKVLTVSDSGSLEWQEFGSSLPDIPTSQTQFSDYLLAYAENSSEPSWVQIQDSVTSIPSDSDHSAVENHDDLILSSTNGEAIWRPLWNSNFDSTRLIPEDGMYDGMVLRVRDNMPTWESAVWDNIISIPTYSNADDGKVLMVVDGNLEWVMPS